MSPTSYQAAPSRVRKRRTLYSPGLTIASLACCALYIGAESGT